MKNNTDVKISVDNVTRKWLAKMFGCNEEQALAIVVSAAGKNRNKEDSRE